MSNPPEFHYVSVWFLRNEVGDFQFSLRLTEQGKYHLSITEKDNRDPYKTNYTFDTYDSVIKYIEILIKQALTDRDEYHPFTHFQYSIPYFPTVIVPINNINCDNVYKCFCEAVDFYFN